MGKTTVVSRGSKGVSFAGLLTILFIGLKLTGNLAWSWVWILSPLWIGIALVVSAILLATLIAGLILYFSQK